MLNEIPGGGIIVLAVLLLTMLAGCQVPLEPEPHREVGFIALDHVPNEPNVLAEVAGDEVVLVVRTWVQMGCARPGTLQIEDSDGGIVVTPYDYFWKDGRLCPDVLNEHFHHTRIALDGRPVPSGIVVRGRQYGSGEFLEVMIPVRAPE